jgi:hypothetical protein
MKGGKSTCTAPYSSANFNPSDNYPGSYVAYNKMEYTGGKKRRRRRTKRVRTRTRRSPRRRSSRRRRRKSKSQRGG